MFCANFFKSLSASKQFHYGRLSFAQDVDSCPAAVAPTLKNLPNVSWHQIFSHFSIAERLTLRLVSRRFYQMAFENVLELAVGNTHCSRQIHYKSINTLCIHGASFLVQAKLFIVLAKAVGPSLKRVHFGQLLSFLHKKDKTLKQYKRLMKKTRNTLIRHCPNLKFMAFYFGFKSPYAIDLLLHYDNRLETVLYQRDVVVLDADVNFVQIDFNVFNNFGVYLEMCLLQDRLALDFLPLSKESQL